MAEGQRRGVRIVGQHREVVRHLLYRVGVVVAAAVGAVAQEVEHHPPPLGRRLDESLQSTSPHFGDALLPWVQKCWVICS